LDKKKLIKAILEKLEKDLETTINSARAALEEATHEDNKPENEYDTRGLEASYLAGAQAERAAQIEEQIIIYKHLEPKDFGDNEPISSTALVEVELNNKTSFVFVMSKGGGLILEFEGHAIQVVTPNSPLGEALLGLKSGDVAVVEVGSRTREYEILDVQ
jgi:transcription elongation GreA/GreB family factor